MKIDFHSHSIYSVQSATLLTGHLVFQEAPMTLKTIVKLAKARGLDGIGLTDHDTTRGGREFERIAKKHGLVGIPGEELTLYKPKKNPFRKKYTKFAHILIYGVKVPWKLRFSPYEELLDYVKDNDGIAIPAHPFDLSGSVPSPGYYVEGKNIVIRHEFLRHFKVLETVNGLQPLKNNQVSQMIAKKYHFAQIGGSDAHFPRMVARCHTVVESKETFDDVIYALQKGKNLIPKGVGSKVDTYSYWFDDIAARLANNLRSDLTKHFYPNLSINRDLDPIYHWLFKNVSIPQKKILLASTPYCLAFLKNLMRIVVRRLIKTAYEREMMLLKQEFNYDLKNKKEREPTVSVKSLT